MWSYTSSYVPFNTSTDDLVRHAASAIHNGCLSTGLVQVNSQFQDIAALTSSATAGAVYTNAVYRFTDSLQSTHPVFINIQFLNRLSGGATGPALRFQVGTEHDGSGTLTGVTSSVITLSWFSVAGNALNDFLPSSHYGDSDIGAFAMNMWWGANPLFGQSSRTRGLIVERVRDVNGNITGDGVTMMYGGSLVDTGFQYLSFSVSRSVVHDTVFYASRAVATNYFGSSQYYNHERGKITFGRLFPSDGQIINSPIISTIFAGTEIHGPNQSFLVPLYTNVTGSFVTVDDSWGSTEGLLGNNYISMRVR